MQAPQHSLLDQSCNAERTLLFFGGPLQQPKSVLPAAADNTPPLVELTCQQNKDVTVLGEGVVGQEAESCEFAEYGDSKCLSIDGTNIAPFLDSKEDSSKGSVPAVWEWGDMDGSDTEEEHWNQAASLKAITSSKHNNDSIREDDEGDYQCTTTVQEDEHIRVQDMYRSRVEQVPFASSRSFDDEMEFHEDINNIVDPLDAPHQHFSETPIIELTQEELRSYYSRHLSSDDAVCLDLANTLLQWRVPVYAFDDIMKWMQRSVAREGFNPLLPQKSYKTFMVGVRKNMRANKPESVPVRLEWGAKLVDEDGAEQNRYPYRTVDVITFNFRREVENLLAQDFASQSANLVLNPCRNDWFRPYQLTPNQAIDEIMTGSCYQNYIKNVWARRPDRHNCYVKGLMLYVDGTPCDGSQRFGLEPLLFTFVDFKRKVRNQPEAWGYLGLIPDIYLSSKAGKTVAGNDAKRSGESSRNFHKILEVLLRPVLEVQESGFPNFPVQIDNVGKICTLLVPIFLVTCDGLEADKIGIRKINYRQDCVRICPGCDCSCYNADNVEDGTSCNFLDQSTIARLCHDALLEPDASQGDAQSKAAHILSNQYNMHRCSNAFFPFKHLGGDEHGIFGASPPCFSHVMEHGIYKQAIASFFKLCSSTILYELDMLAQALLCKCPRQTSRRRFPRVTFTHGITNLTKLTCKEMTGLIFTLGIITATQRCSRLLHKRLKNKQGREDHKMNPEALHALIRARGVFFSENESVGSRLTKVFSSLLAFQAWTKKKDGFWLAAPDIKDKVTCRLNANVRQAASNSIRVMQHMLKGTIPRTEGNGWKTQKFHSMTHFPASIAKFGSPRNTDTACMEKNHKLNAKGPAFTAQKRVASFLPQSAERICDHLSIRRACRRFGISKVQVFRDDEDDEIWGEDVHKADEEPSQPKKHRTAGAPRNKFVGLKLKLVSVRSNPLNETSLALIFHDQWWTGNVDRLPKNTKHGRECYLRDRKRPFQIPGPARKYLTNAYRHNPGSTFVFTEIKREMECGRYQTIRCHPDHNHQGPWYDWANFSFYHTQDIIAEIPCKILALYLKVEFVDGANLNEGGTPLHDLPFEEREELVEVLSEVESADKSLRKVVSLVGEVRAVVHCCEYPRSESDKDLDTCLMSCWTLEYEPNIVPSRRNSSKQNQNKESEPIIRSVSLATMSEAVFVLEEYPGVHDSKPAYARNIFRVSEQQKWSDEFT